MGNRARIIDAAVELMNKNGSVVGTTQLTEHLSISPGNLYYHFRNREEILVEVLKQLQTDLDAVMELTEGEVFDAQRLARCFAGGAEVLWRYRFFFSSSQELVMKDAKLASAYRDFCTRGTEQVQEIIQCAIECAPGPLTASLAEQEKLAETMWILWTSWPRYTEVVKGKQTAANEIKRSHENLALSLKPYLSSAFFADVMRHTDALQ